MKLGVLDDLDLSTVYELKIFLQYLWSPSASWKKNKMKELLNHPLSQLHVLQKPALSSSNFCFDPRYGAPGMSFNLKGETSVWGGGW